MVRPAVTVMRMVTITSMMAGAALASSRLRGARLVRRSRASCSGRNRSPQQLFDRPELIVIVGRYKAGRPAARLHSSGAANPMHVIFRRVRKIVINDVTDIGDIDPTGSNVRCYQHAVRASAESLEGGPALRQPPIAMENRDAMADFL